MAKGRTEDASLRQVSKHPLTPYRLYVAWTRVLYNHQDRSVAKGFIGRESLYVVNDGVVVLLECLIPGTEPLDRQATGRDGRGMMVVLWGRICG